MFLNGIQRGGINAGGIAVFLIQGKYANQMLNEEFLVKMSCGFKNHNN